MRNARHRRMRRAEHLNFATAEQQRPASIILQLQRERRFSHEYRLVFRNPDARSMMPRPHPSGGITTQEIELDRLSIIKLTNALNNLILS